tara:strand:+ start:274 stop:873 length:600 start_codon:yes stop_codon:yes gene_type:complete
MTFRIENKYEISHSNIPNLYNFLKENNAKEIFKKRQINSIYFDNKRHQSFLDSEEGIVPRKKIRIRFYGNQILKNLNHVQLEEKFNSYEGRFKKVKKIKDFKKYLRSNIFDEMYGLCIPTVIVSYIREYYLLDKYRLTFDKNITYRKYNSKTKFQNFRECILEVKCLNLDDIDNIDKILPFKKIRYSKYCNSIKYLGLN